MTMKQKVLVSVLTLAAVFAVGNYTGLVTGLYLLGLFQSKYPSKDNNTPVINLDHPFKELVVVLDVVVDYDKPFEDMLAAGHFQKVDELISEEDFPPKKHEHGKREVQFKLLNLGSKVVPKDMYEKVDAKGCRPATLRELLAFCEANPDMNFASAIFVIGSVADILGRARCCTFYMLDGKRNLHNWVLDDEIQLVLFLAVKK